MSEGNLNRHAGKKRSHRNRRSAQQARHQRVAARSARTGDWGIGAVHGPRAQQALREQEQQHE